MGNPGLRGEKGEAGVSGMMGAPGKQGGKGIQGLNGRDGLKGNRGRDGPPGYKGDQGERGYQGQKGVEGPTGPPGPPGSTSPWSTLLSGHRTTEGYFEMPGGPYQSTGSSKKRPRRNIEDQTFEKYGAKIESLEKQIKEMKEPKGGDKTNPARSCKDMHECSINYNDGFYWIDPNQGSASDAMFVYCNFTNNGQTCIYPDTPHDKDASHSLDIQDRTWFSQSHNGFTISYKAIKRTQLNFLRLLSEFVTQNVSITTSNNVHIQQIDFRRLTWTNGQRDVDNGIVTIDSKCNETNCNVASILSSYDVDILPITDFRVHPVVKNVLLNVNDDYSTSYTFYVGPVCFT